MAEIEVIRGTLSESNSNNQDSTRVMYMRLREYSQFVHCDCRSLTASLDSLFSKNIGGLLTLISARWRTSDPSIGLQSIIGDRSLGHTGVALYALNLISMPFSNGASEWL